MLVMEAVCIFMQIEPVRKTHPDRPDVQRLVGHSIKPLPARFLNKLKTYDKDKIKKKVIQGCCTSPNQVRTQANHEGVQGGKAWLGQALVDYDAVIKVVPKSCAG